MKAKLLIGALLAFFAFCGVLIVLLAHFRGAGAEGPAQPIAFSHPIHVETVGLDCAHCHATADRSRRPGMPSVALCMECHEQAAADRPEVRKLREHRDAGRPIEWARVYGLPWHVGFSHKPHIRAGVECAACHGELRAQPRVRRVSSLEMGWCVGCHRDRTADTDCWACHR
ncbi:MAG: cytochrome c3 family protein [Candidatus Eisenbacteria bacterium]|uniref:Cytochrome c3 family protein n=1 Tax=Eiseniibacteriota bacterium TaxID=2212470 RepID=A0A937XB34_UNCEI|nr:cytochrome c3 family protein [Candidatus Eisenbacteria bacterium]